MKDVRVIEVKKSVFESNDERAALLRKDLKDKGVFLLNLMSSPGAGKTTTLTRTIEQLKDDLRIGVMEADIDSDVDAKKILEKYNQQQIISIADKMPQEKQEMLAEQVLKIDFEELKELYEKTFEDIYVDLEQLEPIRGVNPDKLPKEKLDEYEQIATKIIKQNKFAVATMAGGQGTRLRTFTSKRYI